MSRANFSGETADDIDSEVKKLLDAAYGQARSLLTEHRDKLETVAQELMRVETIDAATFKRLIGQASPANAAPAPA